MALTSCNLVTGEVIDCRDSTGGIDTIYITEFQNVPQANITATSGIITAMTQSAGKKFWTYEMEKQNAQFTEDIVVSVENGTVFYTQTLVFNLKKLSAQKRNNLRLLAQNRLLIIVKDNNGVYWLLGQTKGMDMSGTNNGLTGKAFGDLNGYNLSFVGMEPLPANQLTSSLITALTT